MTSKDGQSTGPETREDDPRAPQRPGRSSAEEPGNGRGKDESPGPVDRRQGLDRGEATPGTTETLRIVARQLAQAQDTVQEHTPTEDVQEPAPLGPAPAIDPGSRVPDRWFFVKNMHVFQRSTLCENVAR
jgi:hypothetical protein